MLSEASIIITTKSTGKYNNENLYTLAADALVLDFISFQQYQTNPTPSKAATPRYINPKLEFAKYSKQLSGMSNIAYANIHVAVTSLPLMTGNIGTRAAS